MLITYYIEIKSFVVFCILDIPEITLHRYYYILSVDALGNADIAEVK